MAALDPLIHAPARLQLCAMLSAVDEARFGLLRERIGVSDSVLSKHLAALTEAGYVKPRKAHLDGRRTTWVALTGPGREAYAAHVAALRALIDGPAGDGPDASIARVDGPAAVPAQRSAESS